jgi:hypothetical protein
MTLWENEIAARGGSPAVPGRGNGSASDGQNRPVKILWRGRVSYFANRQRFSEPIRVVSTSP